MRGNNFFYKVIAGQSIAPQIINNTTVNGATILEPWGTARQLTFIYNGGAYVAGALGTLKVQVQARVGGAWSDLVDTSAAVVKFDDADLVDGGSGENGVLIGTLRLGDIDAETYKAVRCVYVNAAAFDAGVAVSHILSDRYDHPSAQADELKDFDI